MVCFAGIALFIFIIIVVTMLIHFIEELENS